MVLGYHPVQSFTKSIKYGYNNNLSTALIKNKVQQRVLIRGQKYAMFWLRAILIYCEIAPPAAGA